jgi:peptide-methionine (S)-S-oxide reductase
LQAAFAAVQLAGLEEAFRNVPGVLRVRVIRKAPDAGRSATTQTDEASAGALAIVHAEYDPAVVNYERLLAVFWETRDAAAKSGRPAGHSEAQPQVAHTAVYYFDDDQRIRASMAKIQLERSGRSDPTLLTRILPAPENLATGRHPTPPPAASPPSWAEVNRRKSGSPGRGDGHDEASASAPQP